MGKVWGVLNVWIVGFGGEELDVVSQLVEINVEEFIAESVEARWLFFQSNEAFVLFSEIEVRLLERVFEHDLVIGVAHIVFEESDWRVVDDTVSERCRAWVAHVEVHVQRECSAELRKEIVDDNHVVRWVSVVHITVQHVLNGELNTSSAV